MDRVLKSFGLLLLLLLISSGCSKTASSADQVFPESLGDCTSTAVKNRYVARKVDGTLEVITANSREDLMENYVKPHLPELKYVEEDQVIHLQQSETLASPITTLSATSPTWGPDRIQAAQAWNAGDNGQNVIVAVVDSGVDITHPSLANQIYINLAEKNGQPGVDDDNNGFIDDINGWDFTANSPNMHDTGEHGTHVSGIIAAVHAASNPMLGMAPQAKILPLTFINGESGNTSDAIKAIDYAKVAGAKIINASWGSAFCSQLLKDDISSLKDANILFVTASGNGDSRQIGYDISVTPEYPAVYDAETQITVGAMTSFGLMASFSNYGQLVNVMAPGVGILSTIPGNQYAFLDGTSMATPMVSGFAALLLSARPSLNAVDLKNLVLQGIFKNNYPVSTQGEINMPAALAALAATPLRSAPSVP